VASSLWIIPFGKHNGKPIEDVPTSYLEWLTEQDWFVEKFSEGSKAIGKELEFRQRFDDGDEPEEDRNWNRWS
jgi:uncharacterized protein (DUF3820 family)